MNDSTQAYPPSFDDTSSDLASSTSAESNRNSEHSHPIAIVGTGCRFPGGINNLDDLWRHVCAGDDLISEVPLTRWDNTIFFSADPAADGKINSRYGGFIDNVDIFDNEFFHISPKEARALDPQHRLLLEVTWEALENAVINPKSLFNSNTGVFTGISNSDYYQLLAARKPAEIDAYVGSGSAHSLASGRTAFILGLKGPVMSIDTACSTALMAVHCACQSLRNGECDMALAQAVNLILSPLISINHSRAKMLAPDGRCKVFDAGADGFVRADGCGVIVLKRLSDALQNGDRIVGVIQGSAINHDGHSSGLTVPNGQAQQQVMHKALNDAGVRATEVAYVEAHGTGTALGDPIEVNALNAVYGQQRDKHNPLILGSVKANIGHAESAAGMAGLFKALLVLAKKYVPPQIHLKTLNPHIDWQHMPIRVPQVGENLSAEAGGSAAVSSFGFGGSNAHVILASASKWAPDRQCEQVYMDILKLSAANENALVAQREQMLEFLTAASEGDLNGICFSANVGRSDFPHRLAVTGRSVADIIKNLTAAAPSAATASAPVFLFTGQGSQYRGMGKQLYACFPQFREVFDRCAEVMQSSCDTNLLDVLEREILDQTQYSQPAIYALEVSLAALWESWGVLPCAVIGHSVGEYAAAAVAGVFSVEQGMKLIIRRGALMQALPDNGGMQAVFGAAASVTELLNSEAIDACIASINGPEIVVISGANDALIAAEKLFAHHSINCVPLNVSHAFHSPLMLPMRDEFVDYARQFSYCAPHTPFISCLRSAVHDGPQSAEYWASHITEPVAFLAGVQEALDCGHRHFLEIGPSPVLSGMLARCTDEPLLSAWSLQRGVAEETEILAQLAKLYNQGSAVDWSAVAQRGGKNVASFTRLALPTYAFQRRRFWAAPPCWDEVLTQHDSLADSGYFLEWLPLDAPLPEPQLCAGKTLLMGSPKRCEALRQVLLAQHEHLVHSNIIDSDEIAAAAAVIWVASAQNYAESISEVQALTALMQGLAASKYCGHFHIVTCSAVALGGADLPAGLFQSILWGMGRSFQLEAPDIQLKLVDLADYSASSLALFNRCVNQQKGAYSSESQWAIRHQRCYRARLNALSLASERGASSGAKTSAAQAYKGLWWITGGCGALGLHLTKHLLNKGAKAVVLTSRRPCSAELADSLRALNQDELRVHVHLGDVCDGQAMAAIRQRIKAYGELNGVIHAAGIAGYDALEDLNEQRLGEVMSAKILGAYNVHKVTEQDALEHFIGFSSIASVWGSKGQIHYAGACRFLDQLMHCRRSLGLAGLSINWGPWSGGGMADEQTQKTLSARGISSLSAAQNLVAFDRAVANGKTQCTVANISMPAFSEMFSLRRQDSLFAGLDAGRPAQTEVETEQHKHPKDPQVLNTVGCLEELIVIVQRMLADNLGYDNDEPGFDQGRGYLPAIDKGFSELGMDSVSIVALRNSINTAFNLSLAVNVMYDYPTVHKLSQHLFKLLQINVESAPAEQQAAKDRVQQRDIAIIGMACRFPGANNTEEFWQLLASGEDAIGDIPSDRWDGQTFFHPEPQTQGKYYTLKGGFLDDVKGFDAEHFGISPREALYMDPQQRLLMELSWQAFEAANMVPRDEKHRHTGIFIGASAGEYGHMVSNSLEDIDPYTITGNTANTLAGRLAYFFDLDGPSMVLDTACSSSLVATHLACQSLRNNECEQALVGGVNLILEPRGSIAACQAGMLAPDGRCKTFDDAADGYVRSEGCAALILKPLAAALRDGDQVLATICGEAVNQDGASSGLTAPSGLAQEKLIAKALAMAGVRAEELSYLEAHGTGTALGDPIEIMAASAALKGDARKTPLLVGSVKTNIGHLEAAAGLAGLIKVVLAMEHNTLPAHLHFHRPSAHIPWQDLSLEVTAQATPWQQADKYAGISSFGFSGTNAHVIVRSPPTREVQLDSPSSPHILADTESKTPPDSKVYVLVLSARSEASLRQLAQTYRRYLAAETAAALADICYSAALGRKHFDVRMAVAGTTRNELQAGLENFTCYTLAQRESSSTLRSFSSADRPYSPQWSKSLVRAYCKGEALDWRRVYQGCQERFVSLPGIVFTRQNFWLPDSDLAAQVQRTAEVAGGDASACALPGKRMLLANASGDIRFECQLRYHWHYLKEHRVYDRVVVPAAFFIQLALAGRQHLQSAPQPQAQYALLHSHVLQPLCLATGQEVLQTLFTPDKRGGWWCEIYSQPASAQAGESWTCHFRAHLSPEPASAAIALAESHSRNALSEDIDALYRGFERQGVSYGAQFKVIEYLRVDADKALAQLRVSAAMASLQQGVLHPILLDACFQVCSTTSRGLIASEGEGSVWLPVAVDEISAINTLTMSQSEDMLWCKAWRHKDASSEVFKCTIELFHRSGKRLMSLRGFTLRAAMKEKFMRSLSQLSQSRLNPTEGPQSYIHRWHPLHSTSGREEIKKLCVLADESQNLTGFDAVSFAGPWRRINIGSLSSLNAEDLHNSHILYVASLAAKKSSTIDRAGQFLSSCQYLLQLSEQTPGLDWQMWVATCDAMQVDAMDAQSGLDQTPLWGMGKVFALEQMQHWGGMIDLQKPVDEALSEADWGLLLEAVASFGSGDSAEPLLACRDGQYFAARLEKYVPAPQDSELVAADCTSAQPNNFSLDMCGSYLITGGFGALGLQVASLLIRMGAKKLILCGRSAASAAARELIDGFKSQAIAVQEVICDIADAQAVSALLDDTPLKGIIHGAGVVDDGLMVHQTDGRLKKVMAPKAQGAWHLHCLTENMALDFFICFSSSASLLGVAGQSTYAAANAFMDGLMHYRQRCGLAGLSVHWGGWSDIGMAADLPSEALERLRQQGVNLISPEAGTELLEYYIQHKVSGCIAALDIHWPSLASAMAGNKSLNIIQHLLPLPPTAAVSDPSLGAQHIETISEQDVSEQDIHSYVRQALQTSLRITELITGKQSLAELGMDSLMAMEMRNKFNKALGVDVSVEHFLGDKTVESLARYTADLHTSQSGNAVAESAVPSALANDAFPLSANQQALWYLYLTSPDSAAYNAAFTARICSAVDLERLQQCLRDLAGQHRALRSRFTHANGVVMQEQVGDREAGDSEVDFRHHIFAEETPESLLPRITSDYQQPFDLRLGPVFRAHLYSLEAQSHILLLNFHHIVCDAWSVWLLVDELIHRYTAVDSQTEPNPQKLLSSVNNGCSYRDFVVDQSRYIESERGKHAKAYWLDVFSGEIPVLNLPTNSAYEIHQGDDAKAFDLILSSELCESLNRVCKSHKVTLFTWVMSVYQLLLHRYSGQQDIIVGSPVAGRTDSRFEKTVGYFVNQISLRGNFEHDIPFVELLQKTHSHCVQALAHQDYPFPLVVEALANSREKHREHGLFQAYFVLQKPQLDGAKARQFMGENIAQQGHYHLSLKPYAMPQMLGQFDLSLEMFEKSDRHTCTFKYRERHFSAAMIARFSAHFVRLLEASCAQPQQAISRYPLVSEAEKKNLTQDWNDTDRPYGQNLSLVDLFQAQVRKTPERIALSFLDEDLTYQDVYTRAKTLAAVLRPEGVHADTLVGVFCTRSVEMVVALYGTLLAGGAYVPLDPDYPDARLMAVVEDAGMALVLTQAELSPRLTRLCAIRQRVLDRDWAEIERAANAKPFLHSEHTKVRGHHLAYVIYTSGSSGKPKGVMIEHGSICNRLLWMQECYGLDEHDRILQKTPHSFDVSVWEFFWPLITGAHLIVAPPDTHRDCPALYRILVQQRITVVHFVPSMLQALLDYLADKRSPALTLRHVFCSGEALKARQRDTFFAHINARLINLYGPTEAAVDITHWECLAEHSQASVPIGKPIANSQCYVLDDKAQLLPVGVAGELYLGGVQLARGYLGQAQLNHKAFVHLSGDISGRVYKTGDIARWREDGNLEYLGRVDKQVKLHGLRIELAEIESLLSDQDGVLDCSVQVRSINGQDPSLVAWVVFSETDQQSAARFEELKNALRQHLSESAIPTRWLSLPNLPITANGKLDRAALPLPGSPHQQADSENELPLTAAQQVVHTLWCQILCVENIAVDVSFFAAGGHSLALTKLHAALCRESGLDIQLTELFRQTTIAKQAHWLQSSSEDVHLSQDTKKPAKSARELASERQQRRSLRRKKTIPS